MVPARVGAVESRPRLRAGRSWSEHDAGLVRKPYAARCWSTSSRRTTSRTTRARSGACSAIRRGVGQWTLRWTAEEGRHAIVIRDYLTVTRAIDPVALERARMNQGRRAAWCPSPTKLADGLVYVALQELATRIAHRNTGKLLDDRVGHDVMARVAADENLHHLFYRDLTTTAIELDPSRMVMAIERQVCDFAMPGTGIPDFAAPRPRHCRRRCLRLRVASRPDPRAGDLHPLEDRPARGPHARSGGARDRVVRYVERRRSARQADESRLARAAN